MQKFSGFNGPVLIDPNAVAAVTVAPAKPEGQSGDWSRVHLRGGGNVCVAGDPDSIASQLRPTRGASSEPTPVE